MYDALEKAREDRIAEQEFVFEEGLEKGREEVALTMLQKNAPLESIQEFTGLSYEQILALKERL